MFKGMNKINAQNELEKQRKERLKKEAQERDFYTIHTWNVETVLSKIYGVISYDVYDDCGSIIARIHYKPSRATSNQIKDEMVTRLINQEHAKYGFDKLYVKFYSE